ncbi:hypothetical protein PF002_g3504 [Phytophthora fragariae]|uniref:Uncharacterized protein n=1 Tax=Phytophthora fragariae TaxID=53985 RepID=A0A6A4AA04_9STRA|nr:hypothetical protein PF002_g3504 [Phytophthora fragariae]KAE9325668.1 hypothetical protein PF001_g2815 [Phytophthora fragariae]
MPGNPCQANWKTGFREFVVASLPQLEILDGKETHRSVRIKALQVFRDRQKFVRCEAKTVHTKMELERKEENPTEEGQVIEVVGGEATTFQRSKWRRRRSP